MEENENLENTTEEVKNTSTESVNDTVAEETSNTTNVSGSDIVSKIKEKKNLIIGIVIALVVVCILFNVFFNTKGKVKNVVKDYYAAVNKGKFKKAFKYVDIAGARVFSGLDKDEYEDFWDEYKEFKKSDDWDEYKEDMDELMDEAIEEYEEEYKEAKDDGDKSSVKVQKITEVKKVGKHLYRVEGKLTVKDEDGEKDETKFTHYVMKKGTKCYLVDGSF